MTTVECIVPARPCPENGSSAEKSSVQWPLMRARSVILCAGNSDATSVSIGPAQFVRSTSVVVLERPGRASIRSSTVEPAVRALRSERVPRRTVRAEAVRCAAAADASRRAKSRVLAPEVADRDGAFLEVPAAEAVADRVYRSVARRVPANAALRVAQMAAAQPAAASPWKSTVTAPETLMLLTTELELTMPLVPTTTKTPRRPRRAPRS